MRRRLAALDSFPHSLEATRPKKVGQKRCQEPFRKPFRNLRVSCITRRRALPAMADGYDQDFRHPAKNSCCSSAPVVIRSSWRAIALAHSARNSLARRSRSCCAHTTMNQCDPDTRNLTPDTDTRSPRHSPSLTAGTMATPPCARDPFETLTTYVDAFVTPSQKQATFSRLRSIPLSSSKIQATFCATQHAATVSRHPRPTTSLWVPGVERQRAPSLMPLAASFRAAKKSC